MIDELLARVRRLPGVREDRSQFGDHPGFWTDGREFLHVDHDGTLDVRLTRAVIRELRDDLSEDDRVYFRRSSSADWINVRVEREDDVSFALELARRAAEANRR